MMIVVNKNCCDRIQGTHSTAAAGDVRGIDAYKSRLTDRAAVYNKLYRTRYNISYKRNASEGSASEGNELFLFVGSVELPVRAPAAAARSLALARVPAAWCNSHAGQQDVALVPQVASFHYNARNATTGMVMGVSSYGTVVTLIDDSPSSRMAANGFGTAARLNCERTNAWN